MKLFTLMGLGAFCALTVRNVPENSGAFGGVAVPVADETDLPDVLKRKDETPAAVAADVQPSLVPSFSDEPVGSAEDNAAGSAVSEALTPTDEPELAGTGDNSEAMKKMKQEFMRTVRGLGADEGAGGDALPKLFMATARAAADGLISVGKKGQADDAVKIYASYLQSKKKATTIERSKESTKSQESKLRTAIKAGSHAAVDFIPVMNNAIRIHGELTDAKIKTWPTYAALVKVASEHVKSATELNDDQLKELLTKPAAAVKEVKDIIDAMVKKLDKLITGEGGHPQDQSEEVTKAHELLSKRLATLVRQEELEELAEKAAALGLNLTAEQIEASVQ